jgi:hypothetical protein
MHCQQCNEVNGDIAKFCKQCGQSLASSQGESPTFSHNTTNKSGIIVLISLIAIVISVVMYNFSVPQFEIIGMWRDATGTMRIFNPDGTCKNIAVVDIGGSSPTCTLSGKKDARGYYLLYVEQGGYNQTTFYVNVEDDDHIQIYADVPVPVPLYRLTRQ